MSTSPLRVAIVGSGPAGFYAAEQLLNARDVDVDGRHVRAPRHPVGARARRRRARPSEDQGGHAPLREDGREGGLPLLRQRRGRRRAAGGGAAGATTTRSLYAFGASGDRRLGIAGEDLPGSHSSTEFVAWYNGHPDFADHEFDLTATTAVVVGNGNVALDVARMLALPRETLAATDVADHALEALAGSSIEEVVVLGRRGPAQAAFTTPELIELSELAQADVIVDPGDMELDPASARIVEEADAQTKKKIEVLHGYAASEPHGHDRRIVLRFFASPLEIVGAERVEGVRVGRTELVDDGEGRLRAVVTEAEETIPCQLVFRSVGYRGTPLPGVPFDERAATIPNDHGRVLDAGRAASSARASTSPAGSSAAPAGSSARTRRTARRPSTRCWRTTPPAASPHPPSTTPTRSSPARRARPRPHHLRALGGDRRARAHPRRAPRPPPREAHAATSTCSTRAKGASCARD